MKKGISLIVLVITIIVIIILAGAVILSLSNNNPIAGASEATFKSNVNEYSSELSMNISSKYVQDFTFNPKTVYATTWDGSSNISGTVKEYISSMTAEDGKNYIIQQGKLIYVGSDASKKTLGDTLGLADPYVKNGLVLWLDGNDFKNLPQTLNWIDRSSSLNNVVPSGFGYTTTSGSDNNGAIVFDGVDDYASLNLSYTGNDISMECWVNIDVSKMTDQYSVISQRGYMDTFHHRGIRIDQTGKVVFWSRNSTKLWQETVGTILVSNTWNHIVGVQEGNVIKMYVNGVASASYTMADSTAFGNYITIGKYTDSNYFLNGKISKTAIYNRALTAQEVLKNYNAGR